MNLMHIISILFISTGAFFVLIGNIGLIRLPDFYSRAHATGKVDTLATLLIMIGLVFYEGLNLNSAKLMLILVFVALTNPVATNALARAAYKAKLRPCFCKDDKRGCAQCNSDKK